MSFLEKYHTKFKTLQTTFQFSSFSSSKFEEGSNVVRPQKWIILKIKEYEAKNHLKLL